MKQRLIDKITAVLRSVALVPHLARQKFIAQFVVALINSRKVQFHNIAQYLNKYQAGFIFNVSSTYL